jgi:hypothetical protein
MEVFDTKMYDVAGMQTEEELQEIECPLAEHHHTQEEKNFKSLHTNS